MSEPNDSSGIEHPSSVNGRVFTDKQEQLRDGLRRLKSHHNVWAMKLSTEDAGMPFVDIRERYRMFGDLVPLQLKIGGPEARNDIRQGVKIGCQSIIAPMIESPYGVRNFISACRDTLGKKSFEFIDLQINIETIQAVEQIGSILEIEAAKHISQVTVGRHDLCRSLHLKPNETPVLEAVETVVTEAQSHDIRTSVGGRLTPRDANLIAERISPDKINTREIGFTVDSAKQSVKSVEQILDFEIELLDHEREFYQQEQCRIADRIQKLQGRKGR